MNKLIIALSVACASACVFADSTVGATPSKITTNAWFSASAATGSSVVSDGSAFEGGAPSIENNKYVIDSELTAPVRFTAAVATAKDMAEVTFNLDTAIVPADVRIETLPTDAKVAFAASEVDDSNKGYYAWLGSDWVQLSGTPKADGESYNLGVTFKGDKVQFRVDGTVLTTNNVEWFSYGAGAAVPTTMAIDLVGSGNVTSLVGNQLTIEAEIVAPADCGPIEIPETDMKAFDAAKGTYATVDAFIAAPAVEAFGSGFQTTGISVGTAYALGLVDKDGDGKMAPVDGGELKAHAIAESTTAGIKIGLNVTPRPDTGATIAFKVVDEKSTEVEGVTIDQNFNILIPSGKLAKGLKTYKVQAVVTPKAK